MKTSRAFTLTELLVVMAVICLVIAIVMPLLARARESSRRIMCADNLRQLAEGAHCYQCDFQDRWPVVTTTEATLVDPDNKGKMISPAQLYGKFGHSLYTPGTNRNLTKPDDATVSQKRWFGGFDGGWAQRIDANGSSRWDREGMATAGAAIYLWVRYEAVPPGTFVCPSSDDTVLNRDLLPPAQWFTNRYDDPLAEERYVVDSLHDLLDFPYASNCSYAYNDPWNNWFTSYTDSSYPVLADMNPSLDTADANFVFADPESPESGDGDRAGLPNFKPDWSNPKYLANSKNHGGECQNVLFVGGDVRRCDRPDVGPNGDNIYSCWPASADDAAKRGMPAEPADAIIGYWGAKHGGTKRQGGMSKGTRDIYMGI